MHYPILLETELANRWKLSVKTLWTWRQRNVGPHWYTLGRCVRYHVADVLAYEANALPQRLLLEVAEQRLKRTGNPDKFVPLDESPPPANFVDAKTMAAYAKLPYYICANPTVRSQRRIPHMQVVGSVRYSPLAIWHWEQEQSVVGVTASKPAPKKAEPEAIPEASGPVLRWNEITPPRPTNVKTDTSNPSITLRCSTLPSASEDFLHTVQHLITKELP